MEAKRGGTSRWKRFGNACVPTFSYALAGHSVTTLYGGLMCHNHSHLIATFLGEDTSYSLPVLTYRLANDLLKVEGPRKDDGLIAVKTSGLLMLPSLMLGDYSARHLRLTEDGGMSLFCLPAGATTTILQASWAWLNALVESQVVSGATVPPRPHILRSDDPPDDVPW